MQFYTFPTLLLFSIVIAISIQANDQSLVGKLTRGSSPARRPEYSVMADQVSVKSTEGDLESLSTQLTNMRSAQDTLNLNDKQIRNEVENQSKLTTELQRDVAQNKTSICTLNTIIKTCVNKDETIDARNLVIPGNNGTHTNFLNANNQRIIPLEQQIVTLNNTTTNLATRVVELEKFKTDSEAEQQQKALHKQEQALPFWILNTGAAVSLLAAAVAYVNVITPWISPYAPFAHNVITYSARYLPLIAMGLGVSSIAADSVIRCEEKNIESARTSWQEYFAAKDWFKNDQRPSKAFLYMAAVGGACGHTLKRIGAATGTVLMTGAALNLIIAFGLVTSAAAMQKVSA